MSSQIKRLKSSKSSTVNVCPLCSTRECAQESSSEESTNALDESAVGLPSKDTIGPLLQRVPNELIHQILKTMSLTDLSNVSVTNKWFRDFTLQYFFESNSGLPSLLGPNYMSKNAKTSGQQRQRLQVFFELGLLLKRVTCLLPTPQRIQILVKVFHRLDGIPRISTNPLENQNMRFVFQCYGRLVRHLVSGWDDCELKPVFKTLQKITQIDEFIKTVAKNPIGARNSYEYYIRSFYRMICIDPNRPVRSDDKTKGPDDDRLFWLSAILRKHTLSVRARLLLIIFGPLISQSPIPSSIPYIGYWDLTDTFFIHTGLEELGDAIRVLYSNSDTDDEKKGVISLLESILKIPTVWLLENVAALLFYAGDELTSDYLSAKLEMGCYTEAAQKLVFLTLVSHKLTKETKDVYHLIKGLATEEHKVNLFNEIPIAFSEAITDIENAIELEDERDVCEVHEMIEANNDLFKNFMLSPKSSQEEQDSQSSKCSLSSKSDAKDEIVSEMSVKNEE